MTRVRNKECLTCPYLCWNIRHGCERCGYMASVKFAREIDDIVLGLMEQGDDKPSKIGS